MGLGDRMGKLASLTQRAAEVSAERTASGNEPGLITMPGKLAAFAAQQETYTTKIRELEERLVSAQTSSIAKIKDIKKIPGRQRKLTPEQYGELKANLANNPLAQPVAVNRLPDGTLELIAGYNRCQIFEELGRDEIPVFISEFSDTEIVKAAAYSNLMVATLPDYEKYTNLRMVFENTSATHEEISADSGISRAKVQRLMRFGALPEKALEAIALNPQCIGDDTVEKFAQAVADGKEDLVVEAAERLALDEKFTQSAAIAMVKGARKPSAAPDSPTPIKSGKRKFCEVSLRKGVFGIRFEDAELAAKHKTRLEDFLKQLAAEHNAETKK